MANAIRAFVFSHSPGMNAYWHSPYGIHPNQRSMRVWHAAGLKNPPTRRCILKFTPMGGGTQKPDLLSGWNQYSMRQEECLKRRVTATVVSNRFKRGRDGFLFFYGCERA